eukprot:TRINITY_DN2777_c0_g2_i1.p1 TRINITY_DN2777_c0_g2~~TRINITY_DN2777_c0_g2_i1.p1  ORF type:complete len:1510 (-),score=265.44 TRINITY_DN2777_c0_g2_i1:7-4536(-)
MFAFLMVITTLAPCMCVSSITRPLAFVFGGPLDNSQINPAWQRSHEITKYIIQEMLQTMPAYQDNLLEAVLRVAPAAPLDTECSVEVALNRAVSRLLNTTSEALPMIPLGAAIIPATLRPVAVPRGNSSPATGPLPLQQPVPAYAPLQASLWHPRLPHLYLGGWCSGATRSIASLLQIFGVPQLSYGAEADDLSSPSGFPLFSRTVPSTMSMSFYQAALLRGLGFTQVAHIGYSDDFGASAYRVFLEAAQATNITIIERGLLSEGGSNRQDRGRGRSGRLSTRERRSAGHHGSTRERRSAGYHGTPSWANTLSAAANLTAAELADVVRAAGGGDDGGAFSTKPRSSRDPSASASGKGSPRRGGGRGGRGARQIDCDGGPSRQSLDAVMSALVQSRASVFMFHAASLCQCVAALTAAAEHGLTRAGTFWLVSDVCHTATQVIADPESAGANTRGSDRFADRDDGGDAAEAEAGDDTGKVFGKVREESGRRREGLLSRTDGDASNLSESVDVTNVTTTGTDNGTDPIPETTTTGGGTDEAATGPVVYLSYANAVRHTWTTRYDAVSADTLVNARFKQLYRQWYTSSMTEAELMDQWLYYMADMWLAAFVATRDALAVLANVTACGTAPSDDRDVNNSPRPTGGGASSESAPHSPTVVSSESAPHSPTVVNGGAEGGMGTAVAAGLTMDPLLSSTTTPVVAGSTRGLPHGRRAGSADLPSGDTVSAASSAQCATSRTWPQLRSHMPFSAEAWTKIDEVDPAIRAALRDVASGRSTVLPQLPSLGWLAESIRWQEFVGTTGTVAFDNVSGNRIPTGAVISSIDFRLPPTTVPAPTPLRAPAPAPAAGPRTVPPEPPFQSPMPPDVVPTLAHPEGSSVMRMRRAGASGGGGGGGGGGSHAARPRPQSADESAARHPRTRERRAERSSADTVILVRSHPIMVGTILTNRTVSFARVTAGTQLYYPGNTTTRPTGDLFYNPDEAQVRELVGGVVGAFVGTVLLLIPICVGASVLARRRASRLTVDFTGFQPLTDGSASRSTSRFASNGASPSVSSSSRHARRPRTCETMVKRRLLGRGAFGEVWLVEIDGSLYAAKMFQPMSRDVAAHEQKRSQQVQHVNLLETCAIGMTRHQGAVLLMEFFKVGSIGAVARGTADYVPPPIGTPAAVAGPDSADTSIRTSTGTTGREMPSADLRIPLSVRAIAVVLAQVVEGLALLHHSNIVHMDVKGDNILVREDLSTVVADFSLSRHVFHSTGQPGGGTRLWTAPEVCVEGQAGMFPGDVWSLGCTALELATGMPPWAWLTDGDADVALSFWWFLMNAPAWTALPLPPKLHPYVLEFLTLCLIRAPAERATIPQLQSCALVRLGRALVCRDIPHVAARWLPPGVLVEGDLTERMPTRPLDPGRFFIAATINLGVPAADDARVDESPARGSASAHGMSIDALSSGGVDDDASTVAVNGGMRELRMPTSITSPYDAQTGSGMRGGNGPRRGGEFRHHYEVYVLSYYCLTISFNDY